MERSLLPGVSQLGTPAGYLCLCSWLDDVSSLLLESPTGMATVPLGNLSGCLNGANPFDFCRPAVSL